MANCIQVITLSAQPASGNNFPFTLDQLSSALVVNGDVSDFQAALVAMLGGSTSDYTVVTDYGGANTITITFGGATAGYDWPLVALDTSNWLDIDSNPITNTVTLQQAGTIPFTTLYYFTTSSNAPWETQGHWWRDSGHSIPSSGFPGSVGGSCSVYLTDASGGGMPANPVSTTSLALFNTSAVAATNYAAGSNIQIATSGTAVLGPSGGSAGTTFTGNVGDGCTVTLQGTSVLSSGSFGASSLIVNDAAHVDGTIFGASTIYFNSVVVSFSIENSTFSATATINAYQSMDLPGNTYNGVVTVNVMVDGVVVIPITNLAIVADIPSPAASVTWYAQANGAFNAIAWNSLANGNGVNGTPATGNTCDINGHGVDSTDITIPTVIFIDGLGGGGLAFANCTMGDNPGLLYIDASIPLVSYYGSTTVAGNVTVFCNTVISFAGSNASTNGGGTLFVNVVPATAFSSFQNSGFVILGFGVTKSQFCSGTVSGNDVYIYGSSSGLVLVGIKNND